MIDHMLYHLLSFMKLTQLLFQSNTPPTTGTVSHLVRRYQLQDQQRPLLKAFKPMADTVGIATKVFTRESVYLVVLIIDFNSS